jgi:hypothetical protein
VLAGVAALVGGAFVLFGDDKPFVVFHYRAMCEKPHGFKQAAAHSATAPHPVFVYGYWDVRENNPKMFGPAGLDVWDPTDPAKVQLVACVDPIGRGDFVKRCDYSASSGSLGDPVGGPAGPTGYYAKNMYKTNFRLTLYEARTGKRVFSTQFAGDNFGPDENESRDPCSLTTLVRANDPRSTDVEGDPFLRQIQDGLTPYVTR